MAEGLTNRGLGFGALRFSGFRVQALQGFCDLRGLGFRGLGFRMILVRGHRDDSTFQFCGWVLWHADSRNFANTRNGHPGGSSLELLGRALGFLGV